jgi:benzoyl-CoA reductase/2-hydroxyglutaryl-CoA dehydratase subunit BcrC/BadD/HgdB
MQKIAFTTSIPVEILLAANKVPVDLNNIFIADQQAAAMVEKAEEAGYPRNTCGWIKGLYSVALESQPEAVIAVMQGDCSNTQALMETLQLKGIKTIPFAFPFERDREGVQLQIKKLMHYFAVDIEQVHSIKQSLEEVRNLLRQIDTMTWQDNLVSGGKIIITWYLPVISTVTLCNSKKICMILLPGQKSANLLRMKYGWLI